MKKIRMGILVLIALLTIAFCLGYIFNRTRAAITNPDILENWGLYPLGEGRKKFQPCGGTGDPSEGRHSRPEGNCDNAR